MQAIFETLFGLFEILYIGYRHNYVKQILFSLFVFYISEVMFANKIPLMYGRF